MINIAKGPFSNETERYPDIAEKNGPGSYTWPSEGGDATDIQRSAVNASRAVAHWYSAPVPTLVRESGPSAQVHHASPAAPRKANLARAGQVAV